MDYLIEEGLARRQGQRVIFARDLLDTLRRRDLDDAVAKVSTETGLSHHPSADGEHVAGAYRQRVTLASGRFAMIDDGLGFQLVPRRPVLEQKVGEHVSGTMTPGGGIEWRCDRMRGLSLWGLGMGFSPEAGLVGYSSWGRDILHAIKVKNDRGRSDDRTGRGKIIYPVLS